MLPNGGVGIATVLVGLSVGSLGASSGFEASTGVDVIAEALARIVCGRPFSMAKGLGL